MRILTPVKSLFTSMAVVVLLASTSIATPAFAHHNLIHHGGIFQSEFHFKRGFGKQGFGKGARHHSNNWYFPGNHGFVNRRHQFSRNKHFGHHKKFLLKKHHGGFTRNRSFHHH